MVRAPRERGDDRLARTDGLSNAHYRRPLAKDKRDLARFLRASPAVDAAQQSGAKCRPMRWRLALLLCSILTLCGCSVATLPCRVTADVAGVVPVAGGVAAVPFDACAGIIDP